jgi:hypothetical protein
VFSARDTARHQRCAAWRDRTCRRSAKPEQASSCGSDRRLSPPLSHAVSPAADKLVSTARDPRPNRPRTPRIGYKRERQFFPAFVLRMARPWVRRSTDCRIGYLQSQERNRLQQAKPGGEDKIREPKSQQFGGGIEMADSSYCFRKSIVAREERSQANLNGPC